MKSLKNSKGITLVALIITIIVMLILAGIAISMAVGDNGILGRTQTATVENENAAVLETLKLAVGDGETKFHSNLETSKKVAYQTALENSGATITSATDEKIEGTIVRNNKTYKFEVNVTTGEVKLIDEGGTPTTLGGDEPTTPPAPGTKIIYDINYEGGTNPTTTTAEAGATITMPTPTRENYVFKGWYTATTGGTKVEYTEMPDASETTVYAGWAEPIAATSMVGKYADINGDGTVDGLIVIDLLNPPGTKSGTKYTGSWNPNNNSSYTSNGAYEIQETNSSGLKKYYVSKTENADSKFGERDVIAPEKGTTGNDRFYVLGLSDITAGTNSILYWYKSAYGNMESTPTATSVNFETGRTNTATMMSKYGKTTANGGYGAEDSGDMWKNISTQVSNGWFVPSRAEWAAIGASLGVDRLNYNSTYGLNNNYWSSSQNNERKVWRADFYNGCMIGGSVDGEYCVRLTTTF